MLAIKKCVEFLSSIDLGGHNDELGALIEKLQSELQKGGYFTEKLAFVLDKHGDLCRVFAEEESSVEVVSINRVAPDLSDDESTEDELFSDGDSPRELTETGKQIWWS